MADHAVEMDTSEEVIDTMTPNPDDAVFDGPVIVTKESGDAEHVYDPTLQQIIFRSAVPGASVFRTSARSANGPAVEDRITVTVAAFVPPVPPLESVEHAFETRPKP